ncbi:MAG TPA: OmpH family outer membrane protein [Pyrinomonadaceae bacterium]|nr:OmpH family outer membrane protein [Pyrinomonadaceae bacterium]
MRILSKPATAFLFAVSIGLTAHAQGGTARPAPSRPATQTQAPARPATNTPQQPAVQRIGPASLEGRIAIIDSDVFGDQQKGIKRVLAALNTINNEFLPQQNALSSLKTRIQTLVDQINHPAAGTTAQAQQQKQEQAAALQREWEYKTRETQANYNRRLAEVMGPVYDDLGKALEAFARQRGISVILDSAKLSGAIFIANGNLDITEDFIAEYNRTHP